MIKAIVFDLGGVFFSINYQSEYKRLIKEFPNISPKKISSIISGKLGNQYRLGKITKREFWKKAKKIAGFNFDTKKFAEMWHSGYKLNNQIKKQIIDLRKDYKIGAISGNTRERVSFLDKKYDFKKYFDDIVLSYNLGINKPNIKIYKEILKRLKIKGNECVYIDDTKKRLIPARKLGMYTIHFKNFPQFKKELNEVIKNT